MKAAGLKAIDTVVSSVAVLVKSKNPSNPALVDLLASRIRGVISKFSCPLNPHRQLLTLLSCTTVRPLPVQRPPGRPSGGYQNHTRKKSTNYQCPGRRRLDGSEQYGREKENRNSYG